MSTIVRVVEGDTIVQLAGPGASIALAAAESAEADAADAAASALASAASAAAALVSEETAGVYLDAIEAVVDGETISAALPLEAVSIAVMQAFSGMAAGRQCYLSETGRQGVFKWSTADNSAQVTADPYQGLYVAPASDADGSSGAWVRVPPADGEYHLTWFGLTAAFGTTANVIIQSVFDLKDDGYIPAGATIVLPPYDVTISAATFSYTDGTTLRGHGMHVSRVLANPAAAATGFATFEGNGIKCHDFAFIGRDVHEGASSKAAIFYGANTTTAPAYEDFEAYNIYVEGMRGIVVSGTTNGDGVTATLSKNINIHDCLIKTKYQGVVLFGVEDAIVHDNQILCQDGIAGAISSGTAATSVAVRILGSKNVKLTDNLISATGFYAILLDGASLNTVRLQNENITITGNHCTYCLAGGIIVVEAKGKNRIADNVFIGEAYTETTLNRGAFISAGAIGVSPESQVDIVEIANNEFHGFAVGVTHQSFSGISIKRVSVTNNTFISNSNATAYSNGALCGTGSHADQVEYLNNRFLYAPTAARAADFFYNGTLAGQSFVITGNIHPETATSPAITDGFAGAGTEVFEASITRYPMGAWAAATA